jgi:Flp pilus assembly protein TadG
MKRGQATSELAVILPFLALIVLGSIDLSNAYRQRIATEDAVREGARFGIRSPALADASSQLPKSADPNNIKARVKGELSNVGLTLTDAEITITWIKGSVQTGNCPNVTTTTDVAVYVANSTCYDFIKVDVAHSYQPLTPLIANILGNSITLRSSAAGRIQ